MRTVTTLLGTLATTLLLGACGSAGSSNGTPRPIDLGTLGGTDTPVTVDVHEVGVAVRVVNLYVPQGSTTGASIDVWSGEGGSVDSKKLGTVDFGKVSAPLRPTAINLPGQAAGKHDDYVLTFFPMGKTGSDAELISQGEKASPNQKLMAALLPGDPTQSHGASIQMLFDDVGSDPASGYGTAHFPAVPAGKGLADVNATATQYLGKDTQSHPTYEAGVPGGGCAPYFDHLPDLTLHSYSDESTALVGGTGSLIYALDPGAQLALYTPRDQQTPRDACLTNAPALGPIDLGLSAGQRVHVFVYGTGLSDLKLLVVPV